MPALIRGSFAIVSARPAPLFGTADVRPIAGRFSGFAPATPAEKAERDYYEEEFPDIWDIGVEHIRDVSGQRWDTARSIVTLSRQDRLGMTRLQEYPLRNSAVTLQRDFARAGFGGIRIVKAEPLETRVRRMLGLGDPVCRARARQTLDYRSE